MFLDNLQSVCSANNIKVTPLLEELGISTGSISRWKKGGDISSKTLLKLSERLGVTTDFLLKGHDDLAKSDSIDLTQDEQDLINMYRELPVGVQTLCMNYVKASHDTYTAMQGENSAV